MADKFITTDNGGHPVVLDDFRWEEGQSSNQAYTQALENILRGEALVDDFLVSGLVLSGSNPTKSLTAGWVLLGGELLEVAARSGDINDANDNRIILSTSFDATGDKTLLNGATAQTYQKRRGIVSGTSGNIDIRTPKRVMDLRDDTYTTPTFAAGDFVAGGGGPWTVEAGDVATNRFRILGKTMYWELKVENTTTAGSVTEMQVTIPSSKAAKSQWSMICRTRDNANLNETVLLSVNAAGDTFLEILHLDGSAWPDSTNNHDLSFNIAFEIQ